MRVFITGATGFVGARVVAELIGAGHGVLGLARNEAVATSLGAAGAVAHPGTLTDLESLRSGAEDADAVIHLGFGADFSKFKENCEIDRLAIEALGAAVAGTAKPLIVPNGIAGLKPPGEMATEHDDIPVHYPFPRVSEQTALGLVSRGVRASVIRLPQVHDTKKQGLITRVAGVARASRVAAYVGDGSNRWPAAHVSDVARLFRSILEAPESGAKYHAVAEDGVRLDAIADVISRELGIPMKSLTAEEAQAHFGPLAMFIAQDMPASGIATQTKMRWHPAGSSLLADLAESLQAPVAASVP